MLHALVNACSQCTSAVLETTDAISQRLTDDSFQCTFGYAVAASLLYCTAAVQAGVHSILP